MDPADGPSLQALVAAQAERTKTLREMAENSLFFYRAPDGYDDKAARKNLNAATAPVVAALHERLAELPTWDTDVVRDAVTEVAESLDVKLGKVAQPLRVAVSGGAVSPPIDQTLALLGRDATLARLAVAEAWIQDNAPAEG